MSTTWKEVLKGRQDPNIYFSFADEFTRLRVEPAVNGAYVFLEDDPSPNTMYKHYNFTQKEGGSFFPLLESTLKNLPQHPSWLYKLIAVSYTHLFFPHPVSAKLWMEGLQ